MKLDLIGMVEKREEERGQSFSLLKCIGEFLKFLPRNRSDERYFRMCGGRIGKKFWDGIEMRPWHQRARIWMRDKFFGIADAPKMSQVRF